MPDVSDDTVTLKTLESSSALHSLSVVSVVIGIVAFGVFGFGVFVPDDGLSTSISSSTVLNRWLPFIVVGRLDGTRRRVDREPPNRLLAELPLITLEMLCWLEARLCRIDTDAWGLTPGDLRENSRLLSWNSSNSQHCSFVRLSA